MDELETCVRGKVGNFSGWEYKWWMGEATLNGSRGGWVLGAVPD